MARVLQLGNITNWGEPVYTNSLEAVRLNEDRHIPLPELILPILFDVHVLAVYISTVRPSPESKWYFAGFLHQRFQLGLDVGGTPDADQLTHRKMSLDRIQLVIFPKLTATYGISFTFPEWFDNVEVTVWQYNGPDYDSVERTVEEIKQLLQNSQGVNQ